MATSTTATTSSYTGNNSTTDFAITFPFLDSTEIDVTVADVSKTLNSDYTISGSTLSFTSAPANLAAIKFKRNTDISNKRIDFQDGSVLTEADLDNNANQIIHAMQEFVETGLIAEINTTSPIETTGTTKPTLSITAATTSAAGSMSAADKTKLDGIESNATGDQTAAEIRTLVESATDSNVFTDADHTKLNNIEANATADQTDAEIRAAVEAATDSNVFTDADHTKLNNIEANATADQTDAEIKTAYENNSDTNAYTDAEKTKLTGIEANATADQTDAEIRAAVEAATDSNVFTDADHTKLNNIEANATQDQTGSEIKSLYEAESNTNAYTDAEKTKLAGIETAATADQTDAEIKTAYENNSNTNAYTDAEKSKLTGIEASADVTDATNVDAAGAVMNNDTSTAAMNFVVDEDNMSSNSPTKVPTQQSVKAYVDTEVAGVVDSAPSALNTLNELAAALGDDANFSTTVTNSIGTKLPLAGGTMTGNIVMAGSQTVDGRDVSADGSKLDGIESGATADQTASEIKTLIASSPLDDSHLANNSVGTSEIADDAVTTDKLANSIVSDITANNAKVTNVTTNLSLTTTTTENTIVSSDGTNATLHQANSTAAGLMTAAHHDKLDGIEANATADQTASEIKSLYESNSDTNEFSDAEQSKLAGIEANATADQTDAEIKTAYENNSNTNAFTDALLSKLNGIAANATNVTNTNQLTNGAGFITATLTNEQVEDIIGAMLSGNTESGITVTYDDSSGKINFSVSSQTDNNFTNADHTKLDGIESNATADQTAAEIRTLVESASDSNVFTDADHTKLNGIEASATADQTDAEIKTAYENNSNTNAFTDALLSKLNGIAASATNVTNNNQLTNGASYVTSSIINSLNASNLSSGTIPDARFPSTLPAISGANLTGISSDLVNDTSPQLGGDLDMNSRFISSGILGVKNQGSQSELRLYCESNNAHYASIKAPAHSSFSGNLTYTLPSSYGSNAQVLTTDGSGGTSWTTPASSYTNSSVDTHLNTGSASSSQVLSWNGSDYAWVAQSGGGGGGGGSVAGSNTQVQFNNNGSFGGSSNLTFDGTNLSVGGTVSATSTAAGTAGLKKITASTGNPSGGSDGDVWIKYT